MTFKEFKGKVLRALFIDGTVDDFYRKFQKKYPEFTANNHIDAIKYIMRLNYAQYRRRRLESVRLPVNIKEITTEENNIISSRIDMKDIISKCMEYDVISFDIFDTVLYRKVENPNDVFYIMANEIGLNNFVSIRKTAEEYARKEHQRKYGNREVTIYDIYDVLLSRYSIDKKWLKREIEIEKDICIENPFIKAIYNKLVTENKIIVFTTDMYLDKNTIKDILHKLDYKNYNDIILSNEEGCNKGNGDLQKVLKGKYGDKKIIHIGDNYNSDVKQSIDNGIDAIFNPSSRMSHREPYMDNIAGSFYRAVINNTMNNGLWDNNIYYEHGYRVGGILTAGYCRFINDLSKSNNIDMILFCARDCDVIYKAYNKFFSNVDNAYIDISRYAIMNITTDRYLYDITNRFILKCVEKNKNSKNIGDILIECGYEYLIEYLEDNDIDRFRYPCSLNRYKEKIEEFIYSHKHIIEQHNAPSVENAIKYFGSKLQNKKNILIVDIGWSGTCNTALKYFIEQHFEDKNVICSLMCTSRNKALTNSVEYKNIFSYIYSPYANVDLAQKIMPSKMSVRDQDVIHMAIEYMFTSTKPSLRSYEYGDKGDFIRASNTPDNCYEIDEMQKGILDFIAKYQEYTKGYFEKETIFSYTSFAPMIESINDKEYLYKIYKNFPYDASSFVSSDRSVIEKYEDLFRYEHMNIAQHLDNVKKNILFISPEMTFTGTPRSLLRMCKVAIELGYNPVVWTAKSGPMMEEYHRNGIEVTVVPENELRSDMYIDIIKNCELAIANTIVTDKYAALCEKYIPTVWYIREATNLPDFIRKNPARAEYLRKSKSICCVSSYAAEAISKYTNNPIKIIHNCVEDEIDSADSYLSGSGERVKFVQFGTMEYRKGYDVLICAYLNMPIEYQKKSELYFAGGFINSGAPFCSYIWEHINNNENIHYLGVVKGEKNKIKYLSNMDVVVVASRDESCSLVALEGAMLSKPLIVTENVGAKYIVNDSSGRIVATGDPEKLSYAMMYMIDNKNNLEAMGNASRKQYDEKASMSSYRESMKKLFTNDDTIEVYNKVKRTDSDKSYKKMDIIVSLTSHPGRIDIVDETIKSILKQNYTPYKIILWLSKCQFVNLESDLPEKLVSLTKRNSNFIIKWTDDDLKPHKKYFYAMQEFPDNPIVIVDDDVTYDENMLQVFVKNANQYPNTVIAMRANMIMFNSEGKLRNYDNWIYGCNFLTGVPSWQLMPVGVGGVYYPAGVFSNIAFNKEAIINNCIFTDDLWLKIMAVHHGLKTLVPADYTGYNTIPNSQEVGLYKTNTENGNNDISLRNIFEYYNKNIGCINVLLEKIRKDRYC